MVCPYQKGRIAFGIVKNSRRQHPFSDGLAGQAWFDGFKSRHPNKAVMITDTEILEWLKQEEAEKEAKVTEKEIEKEAKAI